MKEKNHPDFIIIGAMKSGTTTLHKYLLNHPDIFMTEPKEPGFFSRNEIFMKGYEWYLSLFKNARSDQFSGEASTCYSRWPAFDEVPKRIFEFNNKTKLIYILRHPVERSYSHYGHLTFTDKKSFTSFEDALDKENEIVESSMYMRQINRFLEYFPKEQLLLVDFEDLMNKPNQTLINIQNFIGCNVIKLSLDSGIKANKASETTVRNNFVAKLRKIRNLPGIKTLIDLTISQENRKKIRRGIVGVFLNSFLGQWLMKTKKDELSPMLKETRTELLKKFKDDTHALEQYWERDLSRWYS
jgi:hypothetical protein